MKLSECLGEDKHEQKNKLASQEARKEISDLLDAEKDLTTHDRKDRDESDRKAFKKSMREFLKNLPK